MKILVVEDYLPLRRSLVQGLKEAGHKVEDTGDGDEGRWFLQESEFDLVILDLMIPGLDGLGLLGWMRRTGLNTRVLVLTARDTVEDRVRGLETGADDYLVKPFAFAELLARVSALSRRPPETVGPIICLRELEINLTNRTASSKGRTLDLTPREYALLELLATRRGRVLDRRQIWNHLYDFNADPNSNVIDVFVRALRAKLEADGSDRLIKTRRGFGYVIEKEPDA